MMNGTSTDWNLQESLVHLLHRCGQLAEEHVARAIAASGLTPRQFTILVAVDRHASASQTDLVRATGVDRSTLADIVRRLVEAGFLHRRRSRDDARAYVVRLTPKAESLLQELSGKARSAEQDLLVAVSPEDRSQLIALLQKLAAGNGGDALAEAPVSNVVQAHSRA